MMPLPKLLLRDTRLILYQSIYNVNVRIATVRKGASATPPCRDRGNSTKRPRSMRRSSVFGAAAMKRLAARSHCGDGLDGSEPLQRFRRQRRTVCARLERYLDRTTRDRLRRLEETLAPEGRSHLFFAEIVEHSVKDRQRKGCFLVNSALEVAPHHAECRAVIADQFGEIEGFFTRCIAAAQAEGTVPPDLDGGDVARSFSGVLLGVRVLARTNPSRTCSRASCGRRSRCSTSRAATRQSK